MTAKLILLFLLITIVFECRAANDYSYDDYEEIPGASSSTTENSSSTLISLLNNDEADDQRRLENDVLMEKEQLDVMSTTFRKAINKIKMKHKRIDMIFLVDSSSSVGKENFANEISFVKRLLSDFNVSFNYTRVALVTFSSRSKIVSANQCDSVDLFNKTFRQRLFTSIKYPTRRQKTTNASCSTIRFQTLLTPEVEQTRIVL